MGKALFSILGVIFFLQGILGACPRKISEPIF